MNVYLPILVLGAIAAAFAVGSVGIAVGDRTAPLQPRQARGLRVRHRTDGPRPPAAATGQRFPVKYYLTAMLFIVFDIEIVFLYPWAVAFDSLGLFAWSRCSVHGHGVRRLRVRVAARRIGTELIMGLEEQLPGGILLSTVEKVAGYVRKGSLWPATFGLACCAIEMMATAGPRFDIARFGMERFSATPRQADLMIVAGRVSQKMAPGAASGLRPDGRAEMGAGDGRVRLLRRDVQQLRDRAGRRPHRAGGHLPAGLPAAARDAAATQSSCCTPRFRRCRWASTAPRRSPPPSRPRWRRTPTIELKGLLRS